MFKIVINTLFFVLSIAAFSQKYVNDMDYVLGDVKQAFIQNKITTQTQADNLLIGFKNIGVNGIRIPIFGRDVNGVDLNPNKPMLDYFYAQALAQGFLIFANPAQGEGGARIANNMFNGNDIPSVKNIQASTDELIARILEFSADYPLCKWINPFNEDGRATNSVWSVSQINTIYAALYNNVNGAELIGPCTWGLPAGIDMLNNTDISQYIAVATTHNLGFNHDEWSTFINLAKAEGFPVWDSEVNHNDKFPDDLIKNGTRLERAIENKVDGLVLYNSWNTINLTTGTVNTAGIKAMALYLLPSCGTIVDNNFDTDNTLPDGWTEYNTTGQVTVEEGKLKFEHSTSKPSVYHTFTPISNNSTFSFDVSASRSTVNCQIHLISSSGKYLSSMALGVQTSTIKYATSILNSAPSGFTNGTPVVNFPTNTVFTLSSKVDFDSKTVDFYANGALMAANIPFLEAAEDIAKIDIQLIYMFSNNGQFYFDNVSLLNIAENRAQLTSNLAAAENLVASSSIGNSYNQYPQSAVDNFQLAINTTKVVLVDCNSQSNLIDTSISNLQAAQAIFEASKVNDPILKIYSGYDFTGEEHEIYAGYYNGNLADYDDWAVSFTLEKGYIATFSENTNGTGASKVYVAADNNLSINLPADLQKKVSFIRVSPWFDVHKKGMAGKGTDVIQEFNNSWHYNWSISGSDVDDAKFVPNQWSGGSISNAQNLGKRMDIAHYMAFNEPDGSDQANMTVDKAIEKYEAMLASGLRLGSPATKDNTNGQTWRDEFMTKAAANGLRVDYIVVHYYKKTTAQSFYNWLKAIHDKWQRPIWVKEFNYGAIWTDQPASNEAARDGLESYMEMLDTTSFVERYSVFTWQPDNPIYSLMTVRNPVTLSSSGIMYRDHESPKAYTQEVYTQGNIAWNGSENSDWTNGDNWSIGSVPTSINAVTIPTEMLNAPVISALTGAELSDLIVDSEATLTIESGGSLIVNNTSSGNVTYNLNINDTNWHLLSSPVAAETYNTAWVDANLIDNTTRTVGTNVGIAEYTNTTDANGDWIYTKDADTGTFNLGQGYAIKRDQTGSDIGFIGTLQTANFSLPITANDIGGANENRWTLVGNPYTSYINVNSLLTLPQNATSLEDSREAIYVFDNNKAGGAGYAAITSGYISPGQGFFVNSNVASTSLTIHKDMLSHQTGVTHYKNNAINKSINLIISDGTNYKSTEINYLKDKTTGLDPRFDIGAFNAFSSETTLNIYSQLVTNNLGVNFVKQSLPDDNYENMIIPISVNTVDEKVITFSAKLFNLPNDLKVFLEDRVNDTFIRLDQQNASYTVNLSTSLKGIGRFYIHTSAKSVLSTDNDLIENTSIYKLNNTTLRITCSFTRNASFKLFNLLGKEIMSTTFSSKGVQNISLPKLASGIYIVQLKTEKGKLNKKIILE